MAAVARTTFLLWLGFMDRHSLAHSPLHSNPLVLRRSVINLRPKGGAEADRRMVLRISGSYECATSPISTPTPASDIPVRAPITSYVRYHIQSRTHSERHLGERVGGGLLPPALMLAVDDAVGLHLALWRSRSRSRRSPSGRGTSEGPGDPSPTPRGRRRP